VLVEQFVVVGDEKDARLAAELWHFIPKAFRRYYDIRGPAEIEQEAGKELPLEQVFRDWPISTDPSVHVERLNNLFDSGATIVNVHSGQPNQKKVIEFYANNVLPSLRNRS
jgi:hypothetical protein